MDTLLYDYSIPAISSLQNLLSDQAPFMQLMSVVFDPKYAFLIYSPLAFLLDQKTGKKLILTTVLAEWLNQVLKWLLHGERPYWYVHSSGHFDPKQTPIKQFPITCELGPGHPSGHAMVTAAVWYIILSSGLEAWKSFIAPPQSDTKTTSAVDQETQATTEARNRNATMGIWSFYALLLIVVSVSRVFLGCHFPHQCLAGATLGLILARWVSRLETEPIHFIAASGLLFITAFGTFGLLQALGLDPSWTIKLATTHCEKREYIHLDTAPFFSIMRYCGFALGCGLGLRLPIKSIMTNYLFSSLTTATTSGATSIGADELLIKDKDALNPLSSRNVSWFSVKILMALLMARLVDNLGLFVSHSNLPVFYSSAFAAYTGFSYAFINL